MNASITLSNQSQAASRALRIRTIPHLTLLGDGTLSMDNNARVTLEYKSEMANLLFQIHQFHIDMQSHGHKASQMAVEILWLTKPVERQPYKARIELYVILRTIDLTMEDITHTLETLEEFCRSSLQMQWFEVSTCDMDTIAKDFREVKKDCVRAVIKEERMDALPFQNLQECYRYDMITRTSGDLHKLTSTLIDYPQSAVSFQLMPTTFNQEEQNLLLRYSQILSSLSSGVNDQQLGGMSIYAAQQLARLYTYYAEERRRPLFKYNIVIWGEQNAVTALSSRIVGQLNNGQDGNYTNMQFIDLPASRLYPSDDYLHTLPWMVNALLANSEERNRNLPAGAQLTSAQRNLSMILTADECVEFFYVPVANAKIAAGFNVNVSGKKSKTYTDGIINAGDIILGKLRASQSDEIGIKLSDLAKHMLIVGTPGSGKTTFSVGLLDRLWKQHHVPFLVIEPAKNEYRALIQSIPELQVFTPGKNTISPFVFNPFVLPKNVKLEAYKSVLKTAFAAGVTMSSPLDKIFEDTVNNCYSDFRWLNSYTQDDPGQTFNIADFIACFQKTFDSIGYTGDARNIGRAGIVCLKSLVNLFDNYFSIPIEDILTRPTVIELAAIENSDQKALIIALILLSILSYVNANYEGKGGLKNFILLEEAHVLLDTSSGGGEGAANPAAIAQGLVKRMLAEIRSYGVGLGIADQSPRKVGIDIVALTDIKVAFRLVEAQDRQILADSTGMDEVQTTRLAKQKAGEAFLFFNKLEDAEEIITPDYRLQNQIETSLNDEDIQRLSTYWNDKQDKLCPYPQCALTPHCKTQCVYTQRLLAREIAGRIFNRYFKPTTNTLDPLLEVLKNLPKLIRQELNTETFTPQLQSCVKVHLYRKIQYETKLRLSAKAIESSLKK